MKSLPFTPEITTVQNLIVLCNNGIDRRYIEVLHIAANRMLSGPFSKSVQSLIQFS